MPRALVTGGTGLVGSHVIERLVRDGWSVRALVRSHSRLVDTLDAHAADGEIATDQHARGLFAERDDATSGVCVSRRATALVAVRGAPGLRAEAASGMLRIAAMRR